MKRTRALTAIVPLSLMLGLAASACSGSAQSASAGASAIDPATLVQATSNAGSVLAKMSVEIAPSANRVKVVGQATGGFNFKSGAGSLSMTGFGLHSGNAIPILFTPNILYMRVPPSYRISYPGTMPWLVLWYSDLNAIVTAQDGFVITAEMVNPDFLLQELATGGQDMHRSQQAGVAVSYSGFIDLNAVANAESSLISNIIDQEIRYIGTNRIPITVWVDHGRIVKLVAVIVPPSSANGASHLAQGTTVTMTLWGYGKQVLVNPPPLKDTSNLDTVLENISGGEMGEPPGEPPGQ
ncbi:MAG: hypothetical protein M1399_08705 [Actinobacteria bacterium]|nr:hypothetical protein [Actinomycetota bacterium]